MDWSVLQREQAEWSTRNFGEQPKHQMLLGIVEEAGELLEARGDADVRDAVGDIVIFMSGYCTANGIELKKVMLTADVMRLHDEMAKLESGPVRHAPMGVYLGRLCHAHLKAEQGIRGSADEHAQSKVAAMAGIVICACHAMTERGVEETLESVVVATWSVVRKRDWRRAPSDGCGAA